MKSILIEADQHKEMYILSTLFHNMANLINSNIAQEMSKSSTIIFHCQHPLSTYMATAALNIKFVIT